MFPNKWHIQKKGRKCMLMTQFIAMWCGKICLLDDLNRVLAYTNVISYACNNPRVYHTNMFTRTYHFSVFPKYGNFTLCAKMDDLLFTVMMGHMAMKNDIRTNVIK